MTLYHHITVFSITESEKARLLETGVTFTNVTKGSRGEAVTFDVGEDHPNWKQIAGLIASLHGDVRSQDLTMLRPTFEESAKASLEGISKRNPRWLSGYSGETVEELITLEGKYRIDSLVAAFEQAILQKAERGDDLTPEERIVLTVEALEREVNNGGYDQFFVNSPASATAIVAALQTIGCLQTANITQNAIEALSATDLTEENIESAVYSVTTKRDERFKRYDDAYYENAEPIADRLFAFIRENRAKITL